MEKYDVKIEWFIDEYFTSKYNSTIFKDLESCQSLLESDISDVYDVSNSIETLTSNSDEYANSDDLASDIDNTDLDYAIEQCTKGLNELNDTISNTLDSYDKFIKTLIYDLIESNGIQYVIDEYGIDTDKHSHLKNLAIKENVENVYDDLE